jgi:1-deoxy-D-xylulose-5-phosphate reductoisomerase
MVQAKKIILLGATGSIGTSTLKLLRAYPNDFQLVAVSAHKNTDALQSICQEFQVPTAILTDETAYLKAQSESRFQSPTQLHCGFEGIDECLKSQSADMAIIAIVGACGLQPTLTAIEQGMDIALANKESLVLGGSFLLDAARKHQARILPIDSEHNAIFQCLEGYTKEQIASITLTASGGALRNHPIKHLKNISPEEACQHPNWSMGQKITIDSSTMANKGLELIEAHWLFDLSPEQLKVVIHPQSIVHSFVHWIDGSTLAQLSPPSMSFAIQHCLYYPDKKPGIQKGLDFEKAMQLEFSPPDFNRYPCLELAYEALKLNSNGIGGAIFNAANEVAVERFIAEDIAFTDIPKLIEQALSEPYGSDSISLEYLKNLDAEIRLKTKAYKLT